MNFIALLLAIKRCQSLPVTTVEQRRPVLQLVILLIIISRFKL